MSLKEKMTALADAVRGKAELTGLLTIDEMTAAVNSLVVNGVEVDARTLTVTPSKSQQNFTSSELGENAYYGTVTINAIPDEYITTTDATADASNILEGKTAYVNGDKVTGAMVNRGVEQFDIKSGVSWASIEAPGFYSGIVVNIERPNTTSLEITPSKTIQRFIATDGNVENGEEYFDTVTVKAIPDEYITTDDATAVSGDILEGKIAYANGEKVTGTISTVTATLDANVVAVPKGYIAEAQTLTVPEAQAPTLVENTVTVYSGYIGATQTVTVGTAKESETFTPGTAAITIPADTYLTGAQVIRGDGNLTAENIKTGVTIFEVGGTFTSDADATASDIVSDKTAYVKGEKITGTHTCGAKPQILVTGPNGLRLFDLDCPENINSFQSKVAGDQTLMAINNKMYRVFSPHRADGYAKCTAMSPRTDIAAVYNCEWHCVVVTTSGELYKTETDATGSPPKTLEPLGITGISDFCPSNEGRFWYIMGTSVTYSGDPVGGYDRGDADSVTGVVRFLSNKSDYGYANVGYGCFGLKTTGEIAVIYYNENRTEVETVSPPPSGGGSWKDVSFYGYEPWDGGGCYILATSTNGDLYFAQNNAMQIDVIDSLNFSKLEGISGVKNTPGYCVSDVTWEMDENENEVEVSYESTVALAVDGDGRLWKLSAATSGSSLAGIRQEQVGTDTDWVWCEGEIDRGGKCFAQKGNQIIRLTASGTNQITLSQEILRGVEGRLAAVCGIYEGTAFLIYGE